MAQGKAKSDYKPNDVVFTPTYIFEALKLEFDLDPAHPNHKTNVPTLNWYTETDDGLTSPWHGLVWCNPPYSKPRPWIEKFIEHSNGIMLIPIAKSLMVQELWQKADGILYIDPRHKFDTPDGRKLQLPWAIALFAMGETATTALRGSGLGRVR